jgi:taurine dioxygenase
MDCLPRSEETRGEDAGFGVRRLGKFGAEVSGIDLKRSIDDAAARQLRAALAEFQILLFRGQSISPEEQLGLTRCFGELEPGVARRPESHQVPGYPDVLRLSNEPGSPTEEYGQSWHSDGLAYARKPHGATMLHCLACPAGAGDTLFASQYLAYEALPDDLRRALKDLYWHLPAIPFSEVPAGRGLVRPMVRVHPRTRRAFLFCAPNSRQLRGLSYGESADILDAVHEHQVREDVVYRHAWRELDVVVWENCALLHNRADVVDFATQGLRKMHRTATAGDVEALECEPALE